MKYLIKLCVIGVLFSMTTELFAQSFRIKAGLNLSDIRNSPQMMADNSQKTEMKYGFHAGATAEFPISGIFSFETGVLISTKGYKSTRFDDFMGWPILKVEEKMNPVYLEVPLTAKVSVNIDKASIYGVLGPYIAWGIGGSVNYQYSHPGETVTGEYDIEWGTNSEINDFRKLDLGLTMGAGMEIHPIQIGINYGLGLANILPFTLNDKTLYNRVLGISVGYKFGKK